MSSVYDKPNCPGSGASGSAAELNIVDGRAICLCCGRSLKTRSHPCAGHGMKMIPIHKRPKDLQR